MSATFFSGLQLTAIGIGLVFLALALLWGLITVLSRLDRARSPTSTLSQPATTTSAEQDIAANELRAEAGAPVQYAEDLLAAIIVAVLAHRRERRREAGPEVRSSPPGALPSRWIIIGRTHQTASWQPRRGA